MILKLFGNNRKSTSGRKDCIKRKKHRTEKLGIEWNMKIGYEAKAMFSGAVYFRDALCNDKPRRKEKIGGLFSLFKKVDGGGCYAILIIRSIISP